MKLGLDIGTNSIGWCLLRDERIVDAGAHIFSDGRDPQKGASLAVDRRAARAMRRRRDRYLLRRKDLMNALIEYGLMPANRCARHSLERLDPYQLRATALDEPLPLAGR